MTVIPLLSIIIFLPLLGVVSLLLMRGEDETLARNARAVGLLTSLVTFLLSLLLLVDFDKTIADYQFVEKARWIQGSG